MNKARISSNVALDRYFLALSNNHELSVVQALRKGENNKTFVPFFLLPWLHVPCDPFIGQEPGGLVSAHCKRACIEELSIMTEEFARI